MTKEETRVDGPWHIGIAPAPGKRSDVLALKDAMDAGVSEAAIADDPDLFPQWSRHPQLYDRYKRLKLSTIRTWPTYTFVFWGPPGTGKTRRALYMAGESSYWLKKPGQNQTVFFDGYDGQETVVIDEFYGWLPFDLLCRMCDRYPLMVDTKGGMVNFYPRKIIITSNKELCDWYKNGLGAMERRLSEPLGSIECMTANWVEPAPEDDTLLASISAQVAGEAEPHAVVCNVCKKVVIVESPSTVCDICVRERFWTAIELAEASKRCVCTVCTCSDQIDLTRKLLDEEVLSEPSFGVWDEWVKEQDRSRRKRARVVYDSDEDAFSVEPEEGEAAQLHRLANREVLSMLLED